MLSRLVEFSIVHRFYVLLATLMLVATGLYAAHTLPIDAVPDITNNQVVVNLAAPALSPVEVERRITRPVEIALSGIPKSVQMRSISQFGLSQITIIFEDGVDLYRARQLTTERLSEVKANLPEGVEPMLAPIATGLGKSITFLSRATSIH